MEQAREGRPLHGSWDDLSSWHEEGEGTVRPRWRWRRGWSVLVFAVLSALSAAIAYWAHVALAERGVVDCRPRVMARMASGRAAKLCADGLADRRRCPRARHR